MYFQSLWIKAYISYISGDQLFLVADALNSDLPLADEGEVERVGGDEEQIWNTKQIKYQPIYLTRVCLCVCVCLAYYQ